MPNKPLLKVRCKRVFPYYNINLRTARVEKGLRLKDLAELLGVNSTLICHYEMLRVYPPDSTRSKLAEVLEKTEDFLFPLWVSYLTKKNKYYKAYNKKHYKKSQKVSSYNYRIRVVTLDNLSEKDFPLEHPILKGNRISECYEPELTSIIKKGLMTLSCRERDIIIKKFGVNGTRYTNAQICQNIGINGGKITVQRMNYIKQHALKKLKKF